MVSFSLLWSYFVTVFRPVPFRLTGLPLAGKPLQRLKASVCR